MPDPCGGASLSATGSATRACQTWRATGSFIFDAKTNEQEVLSLCDWQLDTGQAARDRPTQLGLWALKQCTVAGCARADGACVHQDLELRRKRRTTRRAQPVEFAPGLCLQPHGLCLQRQPRASALANAGSETCHFALLVTRSGGSSSCNRTQTKPSSQRRVRKTSAFK